ncbi:hypothetical protein V8C42DRAFT_336499 [Trichoderma barbatum]
MVLKLNLLGLALAILSTTAIAASAGKPDTLVIKVRDNEAGNLESRDAAVLCTICQCCITGDDGELYYPVKLLARK